MPRLSVLITSPADLFNSLFSLPHAQQSTLHIGYRVSPISMLNMNDYSHTGYLYISHINPSRTLIMQLTHLRRDLVRCYNCHACINEFQNAAWLQCILALYSLPSVTETQSVNVPNYHFSGAPFCGYAVEQKCIGESRN